MALILFFFFLFYLFIFREKGREGEREGENHQCVVASHTLPTGDLVRNPGMCTRLRIQPETPWFTGWHSILWATPARAIFFNSLIISRSFLKDFIYLFLERGKRGRKRNINVWLPLMWSPLGTWSATQAYALTGNRTSDLWFAGWHSIHWAIPGRAKNF